MISEREFISLAEVRLWKDFVTSSDVLGFATAGAVLYNGKDICLGGHYGELSILSENRIVEVVRQAHTKEITAISINNSRDRQELITAALD